MPRALGLAALTLVGAAVGWLAMARPALAPFLLGAAVLAIVVAVKPVAVAVVSVPGALALQRFGGDAISLSELMTAVAAVLAVPALMRARPSPALNVGLGAAGAYLLLFAAVVVLHPGVESAGEWVHRAIIVLGGLVVGAWLIVEKKFGLSIALLAIGMAVVGVLAVVDSASRGWEPAYPLVFHKNYIGSVATTTALVMIIARDRIPLPRWAYSTCLALVLAGLLASQSRGGMVAFAAGVLAWLVVSWLPGRRRSTKTAVLVAAGLAFLAVQSVLTDLDPRNRGQFSSSELRNAVNTETLALWERSPLVGWGVDYWRDPDLRTYILDNGPTNIFLQSLAEGGLLSLAALLTLVLGTLYGFTRGQGPLLAAGVAVLVARLAHASVDQYWAAAPTALTWVIVGAALMDPPRSDTGAAPAVVGRVRSLRPARS